MREHRAVEHSESFRGMAVFLGLLDPFGWVVFAVFVVFALYITPGSQ